ncbi:MAG: Dipeptide transport system permease protein DppB [Verrucomicrobia bacterium ADurb.Bin474]|nr:MAG: Dipeptide transport system permease protein DppB [Verrucomicrobia bacterium ADurb.Bin474]
METLQFAFRKILYAIPLLFGVTLISFLLMVYFGPDLTYSLIGKNPTAEQIVEVRTQLGYDQPFFIRYGMFLKEIVTFDFGNSLSTGERVSSILLRTVPVSFAVALPGFILSELLALALALIAANNRGGFVDKGIMVFAVVGMSISFLIVVIIFQIVFCSVYGLNLFPVQGWVVSNVADYVHYVAVPTMVIVFVGLGYNTRFFRAVIVEELNRDYVRTARAYGVSRFRILSAHILKNAMIPISTRVIISLPFVVIAGNLVIERYFNIPGVGLITYNAITTGDLPIVKAVVTSTAILYVIALVFTDIVYRMIDPRVALNS